MASGPPGDLCRWADEIILVLIEIHEKISILLLIIVLCIFYVIFSIYKDLYNSIQIRLIITPENGSCKTSVALIHVSKVSYWVRHNFPTIREKIVNKKFDKIDNDKQWVVLQCMKNYKMDNVLIESSDLIIANDTYDNNRYELTIFDGNRDIKYFKVISKNAAQQGDAPAPASPAR